MKKTNSTLCFINGLFILMLLGISSLSVAREGAGLYVSIDSGSDANPGTSDKPFKTIQKAQQKVREMIAAGLTKDITVSIHAGQYYLDKPLLFDLRDSAPAGFTVTYKGLSNEKVQLIGGRPIQGWTLYKDGIYQANIGPDFRFSNLMENEQLCTIARTPDTGYWAAGEGSASMTNDHPSRVVMRPENAIEQFSADDLQVFIWPGQHKGWDGGKNFNWFSSLMYATAIDWDSRTIDLEKWAHFYIHPRNRYYLRNKLEFLDQTGEFYLDRRGGILYYKPRKLPIDKQQIVAATVLHLIEVCGKSIDAPAGNIRFENLDLVLSDRKADVADETRQTNCDGMVFLQNAQSVTVRNCRLKNAGMSAIAINGANQGHQVCNNRIEEVLQNGICLWGHMHPDKEVAGLSERYLNKGHTIDNNYIGRYGKFVGHSCGIEIVQAGDIVVSHNLIEDGPRYGIAAYYSIYSVFADPNGANKGYIYGQKITWDNHYDYNYARNIHITHNEIRRVMQDSSDGGAINFYGVGLGNRIENNYIHDVRTAIADGAVMGIYVDDHSNGMVVRNNIVCRLTGSKYVVPMMIKGLDNEVSNNILADNQTMNWGVIHVLETPIDDFTQWVPEEMGPEMSGNLVFERNIFYRNEGQSLYSVFPLNETIVKKSDYNLFYPRNDYQVMLEWKLYSFDHWKSLFDGRYERHSIVADPMFVDPNNMDYRIKADSPALKLGFQQINKDKIGLKKDFSLNCEE